MGEKIYGAIVIISILVIIIEPRALAYMVIGEGLFWVIYGIKIAILGILGKAPKSETRWYKYL